MEPEIEFITSETVDLSNCDREPIHIPGRIQPHGVLLVLQEPDLIILQASRNTKQFFGIATENLLGKDLSTLFLDQEVALLRKYIYEENLEYFNPISLTSHFNNEKRGFEGILHRYDGHLILEIEPTQNSNPSHPFSFYTLIKTSIAKIRKSSSFREAADFLAQEVKRIAGYDRVMIYRFDPQENGMVIAEAKEPELESYLNLHYPASDIPKQARKLYYLNWVRLIVDINYEPVEVFPTLNPQSKNLLDMSFSTLRSVSPIHVEYLQNMGVAASLCISLINERKLWGLIVCHHYQPRYVNYETRKACELLGQLMSIELFNQHEQDLEKFRERVKRIQQELKAGMASEEQFIIQALQKNGKQLLELVNAQGVVIALKKELAFIGETPPRKAVQDLLKWLLEYHFPEQEEILYTQSLSEIYAPAKDYLDTGSGLLAISIILDYGHYHILWFRPEVVRTVSWGGNPHKPVTIEDDGEVRLSPRKSFEAWQETVKGKSLPWDNLEIEAALELRNTLMLAVLRFSQEALEQAAKEARKANQAKSEFLANMSHEIRTPMNAILGFCHLLQEQATDLQQRAYLKSISSSGETLLALINDILDLSKIEAGKLELHYEPVHLQQLAEEIQAIFSQKASEKNIALFLEVQPSVPERINFDEVRLRQILFNVVGNAIKFTEQGYVKISIFSQTLPLSEQQPNLELNIAIEDTGVGIAPEQQERIFKAFEQSEGQSTRRYGGTGLGLAITKRLVEMLGGTVILESVPNEGSKFIFTFPMVKIATLQETSTYKSETDENFNQFPGMRILVADDIASNRDLIEGYFRGTTHQLSFAEDGQEAIKMTLKDRPDLILMDLRMPNLDGREATLYLKKHAHTQGIPILILTASAMKGDRAALDGICDGFLNKPVSRAQLVSELKKLLPHYDPENGEENEDTEKIFNSPELSSEVLKELPILLEKLSDLEQNVWQQLCKTMTLRDIKKFASSLQEWAEAYSYPPLEKYSQVLFEQLETFDIDKLPKTMEQFITVRRSLEELISDSSPDSN